MPDTTMPVTNAKRTVMRQMPMTNAERMYALDEAWNARDWDTFDFFHEQDEAVVFWPCDSWTILTPALAPTRVAPAATIAFSPS